MTAANAHTPGPAPDHPAPWKAHKGWAGGEPDTSAFPHWCEITDANGRSVAFGHFGIEYARLIASAPALLEALQRLMARLDDHFGGDPAQDWKEQEDARRILSQAQRGTP